MRTFSDSAGRTWCVSLNVAAVKQVRDLLGLNLLDVFDGKLIDRLATDPILLVDVLYVVCKTEAEKAGVSDVQFGQAMAGDAIAAATDALLKELVDFFQPGQREILSKAIAKRNNYQKAIEARALANMDDPRLDEAVKAGIDRRTEQAMQSALQAMSNASSIDSPAPSH
jgi:hypothetical protein